MSEYRNLPKIPKYTILNPLIESDGVRRRARTVGPLGRESMHSFYANAPVASHTVRRTPVPFDRGANFAYDRDGVTQGSFTCWTNTYVHEEINAEYEINARHY
ncbi:hypothetical protein ANCCAN_18446 [Ancylostoma caninum]|uniref:Uncharacterized protein n=1 Tax=Ancylostoma caninum TaxID=29170 RepID=A0A368FU16_ANCCA|nr:hypothetical protein ANCCAN_18446 [Ancylostoma caninum]